MSIETCVMPDGNCSGCDHCQQDDAICVSPGGVCESGDCEECEYCDTGEAFCDLDTAKIEPCIAEISCVFCSFLISEWNQIIHGSPECKDKVRDEMRRYLFRNVACEFRKGLADFSKMPDVPGWS